MGFTPLILKYWKSLLLGILTCACLALVVDKLNTYIDNRVEHLYSEKISEYRSEILDKIKVVEANSTKLTEAREQDILATNMRLNEILEAAKRKSFVTVTKEGKCAISKDFLDTYNTIIYEESRK